ncbi:MAG TPA: hypothetical protein VMP01_27850 [Pirellulaceae bacterium]|nr:hypothetical protein [Pirellulaceae bacterium]
MAEAGILVMYPDGNSATGSSDKDGKFTLTYLGRTGAVPGADLKVAVSKQENPYSPLSSDMPTTTGSGPPSLEEQDKMMEQAKEIFAKQMKADEEKRKKGQPVAKDLIDAKFRNPDTSGLKLTIPEGGSKELKIEVP